jgi:hypothetical protein
MVVSQQLIEKLAKAIAAAEGFGVPGAIPTKANNPGDITDDGDLGYGVIQSSGPHGAAITIYPTAEEGWHALYKKLHRALAGASRVYRSDMTLAQIGIKWSGDPAWARNVARSLGCDCNLTLAQLVTADQTQPTSESA